jgi:hypothetical protein
MHEIEQEHRDYYRENDVAEVGKRNWQVIGEACKNGHAWEDGSWTLREDGTRECRECCRIATQRNRQKNIESPDPPLEQICIECGFLLVASEFGPLKGSRTGLRKECRYCYGVLNSERMFGLPRGSYAKILASQGGHCGMCEMTEDLHRAIFGRKFSFDHDHECCDDGCPDCVRGLLCTNHNSGLGFFHDSVDELFAAIFYRLAWDERKPVFKSKAEVAA